MAKVEGVLKQVVSGQSLNVERKYENTFAGKCTARVVFVTNSLPAFSDPSDAIFRRTLIVPFMERIPLEEQDPKLAGRLIANELPAVFNWGVAGLADVLTNGVYEAPRSLEIKQRHFAACNRERDFLHSSCVRETGGFAPSMQLYENYRMWSTENGYTPVMPGAFCRAVETSFPDLVRVQRMVEGVRARGYEGIRFIGWWNTDNVPGPRTETLTEPEPQPAG